MTAYKELTEITDLMIKHIRSAIPDLEQSSVITSGVQLTFELHCDHAW